MLLWVLFQIVLCTNFCFLLPFFGFKTIYFLCFEQFFDGGALGKAVVFVGAALFGKDSMRRRAVCLVEKTHLLVCELV